MYKEGEAMNQKRDITDTEFENDSTNTFNTPIKQSKKDQK
jgi:hypothetical protein